MLNSIWHNIEQHAAVYSLVLALIVATVPRLWRLFAPARRSLQERLRKNTWRRDVLAQLRSFSAQSLTLYETNSVPGWSLKQGAALTSDALPFCLAVAVQRYGQAVPERSSLTALASLLASGTKLVLNGDRGIGKSFCAYWLLRTLLHRQNRTNDEPVPLILRMTDIISMRSKGSISLSPSFSVPATDLNDLLIDDSLRLIVDAVDEELQRRPLEEVREILAEPIVQKAHLLIARTSFFESTLKHVYRGDRDIVELSLTLRGRARLVSHLVQQYARDTNAPVMDRAVRRKLQAFACQHQLVTLDLYVLIQTFFDPGETDATGLTPFALYQRFVNERFDAAARSERVRLNSEMAWSIHRQLAVLAHTLPTRIDLSAGSVDSATVTKVVMNTVGTTGVTAADLYGFGMLERAVPSSVEHRAGVLSGVRFRHWRFQDFFVAGALEDTLFSIREDAMALWGTFIHQELGLFLKQIIATGSARAADADRLAAGFRRLLITALEIFEAPRTTQYSMLAARKRVSHLVYYMGHVKSPQSFLFINEMLPRLRRSSILRRSAAIGLAFGGHDEELNAYIEALTAEDRGKRHTVNWENIGHQLTYFGDQYYDDLEPNRVREPGKCANTVTKLLEQLQLPALQPSWRLDIYSLVYLGTHPPWSANAQQTMRQHGADIERALATLAASEKTAKWPELDKLRQLAQRLLNSVSLPP